MNGSEKLDKVRECLFIRSTVLTDVARDTGLHYQTIIKIKNGGGTRVDTLDLLVEYLERNNLWM
jgi:hypothetical protein